MKVHKRSILTALLASTALASPAFAQTAPASQDAGDPTATTVDEVVVTGIRGSQEQAISIKRNTTAVVDAISAEDIGKLPDVTVADALQRIGGIQIRRTAGEGATVNIRGLPQVVTLMNGEQYLTPGNLGTAQPDLNDIPAQLMNSLVVYKSMDVRNALSGISGTIDLRTQRPFNFKEGMTTALATEYATGEDTRQDDYLFNALLNWRNDRFGVMVAAVQQEANLGNNYSGVSGSVFGNNDWGGSANNWIAPHGYDTFHKEVERKRTGVNAAFTWQIDDGFELTGEFFYTKLEEHDRAAGLNISNRWNGLTWTTPTAFTTTGVNGGNGNPWLDVTEYDLDVWWLNSFTVNRTKNNDSKNFNLELNYDKGGPFTFSARAIHAEASLLSMNGQVQGDLSNWQYAPDRAFTLFRDPADRTRGPFYSAAIAAQYPASQYSNAIVGSNGGRYINPNPLGIGNDPQIHLNIGGGQTVWSNFNNPIVGGLGNVPLAQYMANQDSYAVAAYSSEGNQRNQSELTAVRMDGSYEFQSEPLLGFINKIDVGLRHSDRQVQIESFHLFSDVNGCSVQWKAIDVVMNQNQCSAGEQVPNPAFNPALPVSATNPTTVFQGYTVNRPTKLNTNNNTYFLDNYGSITSGLPGVWVVDPHDFDDVVGFQQRVFGSAYEVIIPGNTYDVDLYEDSGYLNANIGFGNLHGDVGVRAIRTQLHVRQNLTGDTRNYGDTNLDAGDTISKRSYTDWLPSVNLVYDFTDRLKLHAAYNKTMIPLDLGNYGGGVTISTADSPGPTADDPTAPPLGTRRVTGATFSGSPDLDPWRSNNYDLTLEYYRGRATMFSIALFKLDIDSFVTRATIPNAGAFPDGDGIVRRRVPVNMPIQGLGGSLQGVELGAKLAVDDFYDTDSFLGNFGFDGSFTYSDSSQMDVDLHGEQLPFIDNSKYSINAAIWYQDDRLQARVAYNYRTPRLSGTFGPGTGAIPIYQDTAQYVDVNVTYELTDNVTIYANGSNVLGEIEEYYLEFEKGAEQFHSRNEFEPRWSIGARAKF